tara:strand:- start:211 stop:411 length:201 start_codon:yes stop_codon:yes gene_type:complete
MVISKIFVENEAKSITEGSKMKIVVLAGTGRRIKCDFFRTCRTKGGPVGREIVSFEDPANGFLSDE